MIVGEVVHVQMICNEAFCLVDGFLHELERVEIPDWVELVFKDIDD